MYNLRPDDFWELEPKEYFLIVRKKIETSEARDRRYLEYLRLSTFWQTNWGKKKTFNDFCKKNFELPWDKRKVSPVKESEKKTQAEIQSNLKALREKYQKGG